MQQWIDDGASQYLGKTVFFFNADGLPVKGVIAKYDNEQFFVGNKYALKHGTKEFFFSMSEMCQWFKIMCEKPKKKG